MVANSARAASSLQEMRGPAIESALEHKTVSGVCPNSVRAYEASAQFPARSQKTFFWSIRNRRLRMSLHALALATAINLAVSAADNGGCRLFGVVPTALQADSSGSVTSHVNEYRIWRTGFKAGSIGSIGVGRMPYPCNMMQTISRAALATRVQSGPGCHRPPTSRADGSVHSPGAATSARATSPWPDKPTRSCP